jgi:hypothetical protein
MVLELPVAWLIQQRRETIRCNEAPAEKVSRAGVRVV